jgi:prolyl 4-hydroxylase
MVATVLFKLSFIVLASLHSSKGYHAAFSRGYLSSLFAPRRAAIGTLDITEADNYYLSRSITQLGLPNMDYHLASIDLSFPGIRVINSNPPVFEIDNFLSPEECSDLIERAENTQSLGGMGTSQTFTGSRAVSSRTSTTCYLPVDAVTDILQRVTLLTGVPSSHYEETQICRYTTGQQYSWHFDSIPVVFRRGWGNRLATLIVYLNDVPIESGGATAFKDLNLQVQPQIGKALLFFPSYRDGSQDDRALHSGAVTVNTKWIANIWIHESSYDSAV